MKKSFIYTLIIAAFLVGCGDSAKEATTSAADKAKEATTNVVESTKEAAHAAASKAADAVKEGKEAVAETASKAVEATKEAAGAVAEKTTEAVAAVTGANGEALYKKCSACHGAKGEKKALGASQIITGWDAAKVEEALKGYKAGTYGGPMKGVMKGQVASMSDADIKAVAEYIATLK